MGSGTSGKEDIMKKKLFTLLLVFTVSTGVMIGCSQEPQQALEGSEVQQVVENVPAGNVVTDNADKEEAVSEVKGTVDEIKDFMFIVTDDNKVSYAFTFEEKPKGLKEVSVGDKVIVKYTGTISMVDPFMGEILSVEKQ